MYNSSEMVFGAFLGAYFGVICLIAIAVAVLTLVANWKVYKKAGRPGWKCLIPIYNVYVLCQEPMTKVTGLCLTSSDLTK